MPKENPPIFWSITYVVIEGLIFLLGLNLLEFIPEKFQDVYKIGLPMLLLIAYLTSQKYIPHQRTVSLAFFLVSVGWTLDYYLTGIFKDLFSLDSTKLPDLAYTMVASTLLVAAPVIIGWLMAHRSLSDLFIQGSKKRWGIITGVLGLVLFSGLGILQSLNQELTIEALGAAIPFALVFSLATVFREE